MKFPIYLQDTKTTGDRPLNVDNGTQKHTSCTPMHTNTTIHTRNNQCYQN